MSNWKPEIGEYVWIIDDSGWAGGRKNLMAQVKKIFDEITVFEGFEHGLFTYRLRPISVHDKVRYNGNEPHKQWRYPPKGKTLKITKVETTDGEPYIDIEPDELWMPLTMAMKCLELVETASTEKSCDNCIYDDDEWLNNNPQFKHNENPCDICCDHSNWQSIKEDMKERMAAKASGKQQADRQKRFAGQVFCDTCGKMSIIGQEYCYKHLPMPIEFEKCKFCGGECEVNVGLCFCCGAETYSNRQEPYKPTIIQQIEKKNRPSPLIGGPGGTKIG